jgi:hypothetical protein
MLQDGASRTDLFGWGKHSVEEAIALLELVVLVIFRVWGEVCKVVVVGWVVPVISRPLF